MKKNMKLVTIGMLSAIIVASALATVFIFKPFSILDTSGAIAISKINIDPHGSSVQNGKLLDAHWVAACTTQQALSGHSFFKFDSSVVNQKDSNNTETATYIPNATITMYVDVGDPYLECNVQTYANVGVLPTAYGYYLHNTNNPEWPDYKEYNVANGTWTEYTDGPIPTQDVTYWVTKNNYYVVIPLTISAVKTNADGGNVTLVGPDGQQYEHVANPLSSGGSWSTLSPITFHNPNDASQTITFEPQGMMSGGGISPSSPKYIMVGQYQYIWDWDSQIPSYISYGNYSDYTNPDLRSFLWNWYGVYFQNYDNLPNVHQLIVNPDGSISIADFYGGAGCTDTSGFPGVAPINSNDEGMYCFPSKVTYDQLMYSGATYSVASGRPKSLIAWISKTFGNPLTATEVNSYGDNFNLDFTDPSNPRFTMNLRRDEYVWLYTVDVSSQLADTYVYQPSFTTLKVVDCHWQSGVTKPSIPPAGQDYMVVDVQNTGSWAGGGAFTVTSDSSGAHYHVADGAFSSIQSGAIATEIMAVSNLGVSSDVPTTFTITLFNDGREQQGNSFTMQCTLTAGGEPSGNSMLTVLTINTDGLEISGIQTTVKYGIQSQSLPTDRGSITFDLQQYTGLVIIDTANTTVYQPQEKNVTVNHGSNPPVTMTLLKWGETTGIPWLYVEIAVVVAVAAVGGGVGYTLYKRKKGVGIGSVKKTVSKRAW